MNNMKHTIFLGYWTQNTPYKNIAEEKLIPSLKRFNLNYSVKEVPNLGNWYKNTAYKAIFLLEHLVDYPFPYNLVLLDVDCIIEKTPVLFEEIPPEYDLAFHRLNWETWYNYPGSKVRELLTGTFMARNRPHVRNLCEEWYRKSMEGNVWEQVCLDKILKTRKDIKIYELPLTYCYINTLPQGRKPFISDEGVVIRHFQASREFKRKIPIWDILSRRKK